MGAEKEKLIYPELSYQLIGLAFEVFNNLGYGHKEIYFQRAYADELARANVKFTRECRVPIYYKEKQIGIYIPDFLIEDKIVVELKVQPKIGYTHIRQVVNYLKMTKTKLAIIIYFTRDGVKYRRILNVT